MSVSSPAKTSNPSNSSNSSRSVASPAPVTDIDRIAEAQTARLTGQQNASPPKLSTPATNQEFIQFIGQLKWKAPTEENDDDASDSANNNANVSNTDNDNDNDSDDDNDSDNFSPIAQAIIAAATFDDIPPDHPHQNLLDDLSTCFEKFFWQPNVNHLALLDDKISAIQKLQGKFQGADVSVLVNRVLSATGLFASQEKPLVLQPEIIRNICTHLLKTLAESGAELFHPHARRAVYLLECAVKNGLTDAFFYLAKAAQFQEGFVETGGAIFTRAMGNDIPFELAINLAELSFYLNDEEAASNILLICGKILNHWEEQKKDKPRHEELLGNELSQIIHPLISAASVDTLLQRASKLGLKLSQDAFLELTFDLARHCVSEPDTSLHAEKLEALMRYAGLKGSEIWIDEMPLLHWAILNGSRQLTDCLLRLGSGPQLQNDQKQSAIDLARQERDVRLAAVRTAQQAASDLPAEESEKILASLLQQLYDQGVILRLLEDAANKVEPQ